MLSQEEREELLYGETPTRLTEPTGGKGLSYEDRLPDGRRIWRGVPGVGDLIDPRFDYGSKVFNGEVPGSGDQVALAPEPGLVYHIASGVEGWCRIEQGRKLHDVARETAGTVEGRFVEIGTAKGLSATWIGWALELAAAPEKLICVDTFQGAPGSRWKRSVLADWIENMEYSGLRERCVPIRSMSHQVAARWGHGPVAMLYIDALHSYESVKRDFGAWSGFLAPGAAVCFDDCLDDFPGIMKLMRELDGLDSIELRGRAGAMLWWRWRG